MKDEAVPTTQEERTIREIVEYRCKALVEEGYDFEPLIQAFAGHQKQEIAKAQVGELKSLQDCRNVAGETLVNTGTDVWIADRIAELSQAATDHRTQAA